MVQCTNAKWTGYFLCPDPLKQQSVFVTWYVHAIYLKRCLHIELYLRMKNRLQHSTTLHYFD